MSDYNLDPTDLGRLEAVAEKITGPIVELVAMLADERNEALSLLSIARAQARDWGNALVDAEALLKSTGYAPTFALDRDIWGVIQELAREVPTRLVDPS